MKHLRLFENQSVQSTRNMIEEFSKFLIDIKPYIIEKYNECANDEDYESDYGDSPVPQNNDGDLVLQQVEMNDDLFQFLLRTYDEHGQVYETFYIDITSKEMESILIKMKSNKYNL
jgi:hypothetical protein